MKQKEIRDARHCGSWYPGNPQQLTQEIRRYLAKIRMWDWGKPSRSHCAPCGYMIFGRVAAHAQSVDSSNLLIG